jgi:hypothetical protein
MRKGRAGAMGKDYSRTGKASQVSSFAWMVIGLIAKWKLWSDDGGGAQRGARSLASEMHSSASLAACTPRKCIANQKSGQADYRVETYTIVIRPNLRSDISFRFFHSCNRKCPLFGCSSCAARPISSAITQACARLHAASHAWPCPGGATAQREQKSAGDRPGRTDIPAHTHRRFKGSIRSSGGFEGSMPGYRKNKSAGLVLWRRGDPSYRDLCDDLRICTTGAWDVGMCTVGHSRVVSD